MMLIRKPYRRVTGFLLALFILGGIGMSIMAQTATAARKALIVIDPGFSKFSSKIGKNIESRLTERSMAVKFLTVKEFRPADLESADLLVLGGPTYVGQPSGGLKKLLTKLDKAAGFKTLLFITGGEDCSGLGPLTELAKAKGLRILGSCGILDKPQEVRQNEEKLDKLLENI